MRDLADSEANVDARSQDLAERLLAKHSPAELVACLLKREAARSHGTPRSVRDDAKPARRERKPHTAGPKSQPRQRPQGGFITYQVSWGAHAGADTRRLLAMVCRRGDVSSDVVGAIRVAPKGSTVEISSSVAPRNPSRENTSSAASRIAPWFFCWMRVRGFCMFMCTECPRCPPTRKGCVLAAPKVAPMLPF